MSTLDHAIIAANLAGCTLAIVANLAASQVGFLIHRTLTAVIAVLAGTYAIGYALLLSGTLEFAKWSAFYRGVSIVAWPVVWAAPALMSLAAWRHASKEVRAAMGRAGERVGTDLGG